MQQHCRDVPIANLLGFGFTDGRHFAQVCWRPFYIRWGRAIWQKLRALLQLPVPSQYIRTPSNYFLRTGYVILDYIEPTTGQMLSATWKSHSNDTERRRNLFRGLSRLVLSVSRIPLPRIGSWCCHEDGSITLSNRPLTCGVIILENDGAPRVMEEKKTYSCVMYPTY
ncbi:Uncharacterized protein TCAP_00474 [Tolypocladium capitatum]|uniref:Uncharacterized protein n=1 Tax=Tolypocladium capitatum TaxID=45235 RepID=A0A2K3QQ05_9HYPO|nr:Uncharacterized protein TCAP_00474 [Tolypocladium capitatum]